MRALYRILCLVGILVLIEIWVFTRQQPLRIKSLRMQLAALLFLVIFIASRYVWIRFNTLVRTNLIGALFKLLLLIPMILAQGTSICVFLPVQTNPTGLAFISTFSLGSIVFLAFSMIIADTCSFIYRKAICKRHKQSNSLDRMEIKIRSLLSLISALILIIYGTVVVNSLAVEHVAVPIKGLGVQLNGTTIIQVSDIHLGPFNGQSRLNSIVKKINGLRGDIVVITGDLVDSSVQSLKDAVLPLKKLKSKYGVYFSTGKWKGCMVSLYVLCVFFR